MTLTDLGRDIYLNLSTTLETNFPLCGKYYVIFCITCTFKYEIIIIIYNNHYNFCVHENNVMHAIMDESFMKNCKQLRMMNIDVNIVSML